MGKSSSFIHICSCLSLSSKIHWTGTKLVPFLPVSPKNEGIPGVLRPKHSSELFSWASKHPVADRLHSAWSSSQARPSLRYPGLTKMQKNPEGPPSLFCRASLGPGLTLLIPSLKSVLTGWTEERLPSRPLHRGLGPLPGSGRRAGCFPKCLWDDTTSNLWTSRGEWDLGLSSGLQAMLLVKMVPT